MNRGQHLAFIVLGLGMTLAGCGGGGTGASGSNNSNNAKVAGSWSETLTSNYSGASAHVDLYMIQNDNALGGQRATLTGAPCMSGYVNVDGSVAGSTVYLTVKSAAAGSTDEILLTGTPSPNGALMSGTYMTLGPCMNGDKGTFVATNVPSLAGTWSGTYTPMANLPVPLSGTINEDRFGNLSGTLTAGNSLCFTTLTVTGTQEGQMGLLRWEATNTALFDASWTAMLDATGRVLSGAYGTSLPTLGTCPNNGSATLTRQ